MIPPQFLSKDVLIHGEYYLGTCRNACIARWNGNESQFYHWRSKFGSRFIETIKHPVDDERFDVFYPIQHLSHSVGFRDVLFPEEEAARKMVLSIHSGDLPESGEHWVEWIQGVRKIYDAIDKRPGFRLVPQTVYHHVKQLLYRLELYDRAVESLRDSK